MPLLQIQLLLMSDAPSSDLTRFIGDRTGGSRAIARFIMDIVDRILAGVGLAHDENAVTFFYAAIVLGIALVVGYIAQVLLFYVLQIISKKRGSDTYQALTDARFFHKLCRIVPGLVFLILIQFTLSAHDSLSHIMATITWVYVVFVSTNALSALIMAVWQRFDARENKRKLPLKGLAQLIKGLLWIISGIIIISIIADRSPASLLAGLGAFAAVLMLIFKDSILGLVAGVQLSENDSLHVGDWIKVDGTNANGIVEEVTLTSVKVLNWDKTTTSLPPYSLVSGSFTNYRSMQDSGTRRICRSIMIDADSVMPATPEMLATISAVPFMKDYIATKQSQLAAGKVADVNNPDGLADGTIDTNLGLFRAYARMWLDANPMISHNDTTFVSTLDQTSAGIPFQVYCFTATSAWLPYEAIKDTVFEHLAAMLHSFALCTFENPSGRDTVIDGYLSPGHDITEVFAVPQPFFKPGATPPTPKS